ncbi:hypothetical protein BWI96_12380 [Siphonobacter sp. SORGH_AS_0500]|nr:hypothetical protein BWI96_12380 [Siphonobacter sp. SORGH_AS_0500]
MFQWTDRWKRDQYSVPGTKISLCGEFGVVLDQTIDSNLWGIIRWNTEKENDTEDWCGIFGTFICLGGEVLDQDYTFNFINDDGTSKKPSNN